MLHTITNHVNLDTFRNTYPFVFPFVFSFVNPKEHISKYSDHEFYLTIVEKKYPAHSNNISFYIVACCISVLEIIRIRLNAKDKWYRRNG